MPLAHPILADLLEHVLPHYFDQTPGQPPAIWALSNHILMMIIAALLVFVVFTYVGIQSRRSLVPHGLANFFESMLSFLRTDLIRPALHDHADRFAPFIWTVFFFILFCNLLGLIPVNDFITFYRCLGKTHAQIAHMRPSAVWGTATANFSVTGGLAIVAFFAIHISGIAQQIRIKRNPALDPHHHAPPRPPQSLPRACLTGIGSYLWNFAPHPEIGWKPADFAFFCMLFILECAGALVKPFALCVRLFANMVAGHMVLAALVTIIPFANAVTQTPEPLYKWGPIGVAVVLGSTALSLLELFVAFLQAYIFTFLTTLFISSAVAPEH